MGEMVALIRREHEPKRHVPASGIIQETRPTGLEDRAAYGFENHKSFRLSPAGSRGDRQGDLAVATRNDDLDGDGPGVRGHRDDLFLHRRHSHGLRDRVDSGAGTLSPAITEKS